MNHHTPNSSMSCLTWTILILLHSIVQHGSYGRLLENCQQHVISNANPNSSPEISLSCQLRTINSEFDKVNLSSITSSHDSITSLSLTCSDVLFYQSSLAPSSFQHFTKLQSLSIEHCKLSRLEAGVFAGLGLKSLAIKTHNTAWPALSLDLSPGLFNTIPGLERVDLSQNNIWTFPDSIFCPTSSLEHLNVSMNRLQDIGDLGFREKQDKSLDSRSTSRSSSSCKMNVQILDISHNRLILLPPGGLAKLSQLKELYLQANEISVVGAGALSGLQGLKILNLADNKVSNLPEQLFHDSLDLTEIYLQNNSFSALTPYLFTKLNQLVMLDLSHNRLASLWMNGQVNSLRPPTDNEINPESAPAAAGVFSGLIRLVLLNLGYNQLTRLIPEPFQDLYSLQILNLEHNQISTIDGNTFSSMNNLHTLILSHNRLASIDSTSLNGLFVLSQLSIDNNNISGIHHAAFHNCSSLKDLNINGNFLSHIDDAIQNLTLLKTIDLGENQLESTPHLIGLPNLYGLRLTGNRIVNISKDAFKDLQSLKILNLARNQLRTIEEGAFDSNLNLQALRLDANYLTDISNLFAQSPNLIWLNMSDNQLTWFDYALIPKQLQWIDIHKNQLGDLGNYFQRSDLKLQTLDASFNRIASIRSINLPDSLEMIFLNDNLIKFIEPHTFYRKANLSRVDIFANQIETLDLTSLRLAPIPEEQQLPEMYLAGNPIICDCNSEWLQRINKLDHLRQHFKIIDLDSVYCRIVNQELVLPLSEVKPAQFLCPYTNHCFNLCECCEYNACDCQQQCPHNCGCFNDDVWSTNIVDCSGQGHTSMPVHIPMDASELYLDGNVIEELPSHVLIGRKNLQILHLNHSGLARIANNSLSGLKRLSVLHLENNNLKRLEGYEFNDLPELRELYLQHNQISFISNNTFRSLTHLEILKLEHNRLSQFSMWTLSENSYLIEINLSFNSWSCECDFLAKAAPWVQANVAKLSDAAGVNCRLHGRPFSLVYMNGTRCADLTALSGAVEAPDSTLPPNFVPLMGLAGGICLVVGGILVALCRKRKCTTARCFKSSLEEDHEKLYDAYIFYSLKDEVWVNQMLANELERHDPPYRLCLNYRFPPTAFISDSIVAAVAASKRTVLIISKDFIQNEWYQFKSALHSSPRSGGGKKFIAITICDLPNHRELDPDLRSLLCSSTVISANDKTFMSKLRSALPTPRVPYSGSTNGHGPSSRIHHQHQQQQHQQQLQQLQPHYQSLSLHKEPGLGLVSTGMNYQIMNESLVGFGNSFNNHNNTNHYNSSGTSTFTNSSVNSSSVPLFIPPFPPPSRPPPFPTTPRRPPLPEIPQQPMWA